MSPLRTGGSADVALEEAEVMRQFIWSPWLMAEQDSDRVAVIAGSAHSTFGELAAHAMHVAECLSAAGLAEDDVVTTDIPPGPDFFALALAALRGGYRLLPIAQGYTDDLRAKLLTEGNGSLDIRVDPTDADGNDRVLSFVDLLTQGSPPARIGAPAQRGGCLSFVTSGTTGEPIIVQGRRPWYPYRGVAVVDRYYAGPTCGPHLMANPTHHLGTLGPALYALQAGSAVVVQQDWSPSAFTALVDEHGADSAFLAPSQLAEFILEGQPPRRPLKVLLHGGSHCAPPLKRAAIDLLGPVLHEFYGTSHGVISEIGSADWLLRPSSVGRPLAGVSVAIEADGHTVGTMKAGEICVTFRAVDQGAPLTVRTGDTGTLDSDGYLYVLGRMSDAARHDLPALEHAVRELPGVVHVLAHQAAVDGPVTLLRKSATLPPRWASP
jgi:long-chain acyl-CoA synthetase